MAKTFLSIKYFLLRILQLKILPFHIHKKHTSLSKISEKILMFTGYGIPYFFFPKSNNHSSPNS